MKERTVIKILGICLIIVTIFILMCVSTFFQGTTEMYITVGERPYNAIFNMTDATFVQCQDDDYTRTSIVTFIFDEYADADNFYKFLNINIHTMIQIEYVNQYHSPSKSHYIKPINYGVVQL